jgi:hypothetical protein
VMSESPKHTVSKSVAISICCIAAAACATAPPAKPVAPPVTAVCLPLANISLAQQKAAGDALAGLTAAQQAALVPVFSDWLALRDADRACMKGATP